MQHDHVGVQEIAALLGVSHQWANMLTKMKGFPDPVYPPLGASMKGRLQVWHRTDVERWLRETERL